MTCAATTANASLDHPVNKKNTGHTALEGNNIMNTITDPQQAELLGNILLAGILGVILGTGSLIEEHRPGIERTQERIRRTLHACHAEWTRPRAPRTVTGHATQR